MTSIDDVKRDTEKAQDSVLGGLDTEDRLRLFIQEAAEGQKERVEMLAETAPRYEYTATDLAYTNGVQTLTHLSLVARLELQELIQAVRELEQTRDTYVALLLLNEALSRLCRGGFDVDESGIVDAPNRDAAECAYGSKHGRDTALLATKYRELWEDLSADLLLEETCRENPFFPELAATGLLAYPSDLSGAATDDLDTDLLESEVYLSEVHLLNALVELRTKFYGWRIFVKDHLDVTLDELLDVALSGGDESRFQRGSSRIDETLCENILRFHREYLAAYPELLKEWTDADEPEDFNKEVATDFDMRAQEYATDLADTVQLPTSLE